MPLRSRLCLLLIAGSMAVSTCRMEAADPVKLTTTLVEVWSGGDDGLTTRLRDALESAFKSSPNFRLSSGKKPGTLMVTVPSNVAWKDVGGRTRVLYKIEFTSADNQILGSSTGSCWDGELAKCAIQVIKDAKRPAKEIRTSDR